LNEKNMNQLVIDTSQLTSKKTSCICSETDQKGAALSEKTLFV